MAQITPTVTYPKETDYDGQILKAVWVLTTANFDGVAITVPEWADKTWDIDGSSAGMNFGGATVAIQGGNTGTDLAILNPQTLSKADGGTAATFTASDISAIIENPVFMKPTLTVVGIAAVITISLVCRRATPLRK